jgi:hypothetical protein
MVTGLYSRIFSHGTVIVIFRRKAFYGGSVKSFDIKHTQLACTVNHFRRVLYSSNEFAPSQFKAPVPKPTDSIVHRCINPGIYSHSTPSTPQKSIIASTGQLSYSTYQHTVDNSRKTSQKTQISNPPAYLSVPTLEPPTSERGEYGALVAYNRPHCIFIIPETILFSIPRRRPAVHKNASVLASSVGDGIEVPLRKRCLR